MVIGWVYNKIVNKDVLYNQGVYHVISRSIAGYKVFNSNKDYERMVLALRFYQFRDPPCKLSTFLKLKGTEKYGFDKNFKQFLDNEKIINIIAFCLMPTHIHLILQQLEEKGISVFMKNILDSYSRFFNTLHRRKGPLWESRFKHIVVDKDEQLIHLTRYIHSNPTTAGLVKKPEGWQYSSYKEYIGKTEPNGLINYEGLLDITPKSYQKFVNDRIDYQKKLAVIKNLIIPNQ